jgi:bacterioferritin
MAQKDIELVSEQLDVKELLDDLNRAYCDEWLAYYSYTYMAQTASGPMYEDVAEFLNKIAKDEREHIDELANRISELGGLPNSNPIELEDHSNKPYPKPPQATDDYEGIIATVTKAERYAIDVYDKMAKKTLGKDHITYQLITHIMSEEVHHEEMFENLIGRQIKAPAVV